MTIFCVMCLILIGPEERRHIGIEVDLANELDEPFLVALILRLVRGAPVPEVVVGSSGEKGTDGDRVFVQRRQPARSPPRDRPVLLRIVLDAMPFRLRQ